MGGKKRAGIDRLIHGDIHTSEVSAEVPWTSLSLSLSVRVGGRTKRGTLGKKEPPLL